MGASRVSRIRAMLSAGSIPAAAFRRAPLRRVSRVAMTSFLGKPDSRAARIVRKLRESPARLRESHDRRTRPSRRFGQHGRMLDALSGGPVHVCGAEAPCQRDGWHEQGG